MPARWPVKGNPLGGLNLPPDYVELTTGGRRLARLNSLRLQERPDDLVRGWSLLKTYYLMDDPDGDFAPGFFKRYRETPPIHYNMVWSVGRHPYNIMGMPRSFAKSTVMVILAMLLWLTRRNYYIMLIYSGEKMVHDRFDEVFLYQFEYNRRLVEDFGALKPALGAGAWNRSRVRNIQNRCLIGGMPVKGSLYGPRPDLVICDDCEFDPQLQKVTTELTEQMDGLMHNTLLPMLDEGESAMVILGTLHNNRTWISRWLKGNVKEDERLEVWNRIYHGAEDVRPDGKLLWQEKFNERVLARERKKLGPAAYATQRLNRPGEGKSAVLYIHPRMCQYDVIGEDKHSLGAPNTTPLDSRSMMVSYKRVGEHIEEIKRPFGPAVSDMFRVLLMDDAKCLTPTSDMVCMLVVGIESSKFYKDTWWLLDLFLGRVRGEEKYRMLLTLALRWRCRYMGIEAIGAQEEVARNAESYLPDFAAMEGWNPRMVPLKYPAGLSKADRINGIEWRFNQWRIKFPKHLRVRDPMWRLAYSEVEGWTGEEGCIPYDDFPDTVAMVNSLMKGRKHKQADDLPTTGEVDLIEAFKENRFRELIPGVPVGLGISPSEVPLEVLDGMIEVKEYASRDAHSRRARWIRSKPV